LLSCRDYPALALRALNRSSLAFGVAIAVRVDFTFSDEILKRRRARRRSSHPLARAVFPRFQRAPIDRRMFQRPSRFSLFEHPWFLFRKMSNSAAFCSFRRHTASAHATPLSDSANVTRSHVRALPGILRKIGSRMRGDNRRRTSDRLKTTARRITSNYFAPAGITVVRVASAFALQQPMQLHIVRVCRLSHSRGFERRDASSARFFYERCELRASH